MQTVDESPLMSPANVTPAPLVVPSSNDMQRVGDTPTTIANPLELALTDEMRSIVRGNVMMVPRFVGDLVRYFEDGTRPGMTPNDMAQHLGGKASFVLNSLFRLPEVAGDSAVPQAITGASSPKEEPEPADTTPHSATSPFVSRSAPRWLDVLMGVCVMTPAWKGAAASAILQLWPVLNSGASKHSTLYTLYAALVVLSCYHRAMPSFSTAVGDVLVVWTAYDSQTKRHAFPACLQMAMCVAWRWWMA